MAAIETGGDTQGGKQRFYGLYHGTVLSVLDNDRVLITMDDIKSDDLTAERSHLMGGTEGNSGVRTGPPENGAKCLVAFKQGDLMYPIIIGYSDSKSAGNIGQMNAGEWMARSSDGHQLSTDAAGITATTVDKFGLTANKGELALRHLKYDLVVRPEFTHLDMHGLIMHSSSGQAIIKYPTTTMVTNSFTMETSGNKIENVTGDFLTTTGNNHKISTSQFLVSASEEVSIASKGDTAFMNDTYTVTSQSDQFFSSVAGDFSVAIPVGKIALAAGAPATASTGVTAYTAAMYINSNGTILLDSTGASRQQTIDGSITETAIRGFAGKYGIDGIAIKSLGDVAYKVAQNFQITAALEFKVTAATGIELTTPLTYSLSALAGITETTAAAYSLTAAAAVNMTTPGIFTITTSLLQINSPLIQINTGVPILGVKALTLIGPQFLVPFV